MASIEIAGEDVVLKLGRMEAMEAAHIHGAITAPLTAVQSVEGVEDAWPHLRGSKEVGTEVPGVNMIGTRSGDGFKDFCVVHKHAPAIIVTLDPQVSGFNRWVVTGDVNDVPAALKR